MVTHEVIVECYLSQVDGPDREGNFRTRHHLWKAWLDLEGGRAPMGYGATVWEAVGNLFFGLALLGTLDRCFGPLAGEG